MLRRQRLSHRNQQGAPMKTPFSAVAAVIVSATAAWAFAPAPASAEVDQPVVQELATISDAELRSFATAAVGVKRVADSYLPVLAGTQSSEEKSRVETAA